MTKSVLTLCACAFAAYALADIAHETIGHGGMCAMLGGQIAYVSTTFDDCSIRSRIIDGAGPAAGIVAAMLLWLWLRVLPPAGRATRAFLCLGFAFAAFWNFGYLIKSGLTDQGDWAFVIAGLKPLLLWHAAIAVAGVLSYWISIRLLAALLAQHLASAEPDAQKPLAFTLAAYIAAAVLASIAALFDPRGVGTILSDALPSSLGAIGLPLAGWFLQRSNPDLRLTASASPAWIVTGAAAAIAFVALLGPGLRF
ncbi:MAG TPA: hypothetical protein VHZ29_09470 [Rhizomicrobium sp.]|jgi:hypothetical protein|nr:hypothetical protein [Rhizomicrobium sp.]